MSINVKLSDNLVEQARVFGGIEHRSVPSRLSIGRKLARLPKKTQTYHFL